MTHWIALVLAAGKGTRMESERAKVLHEMAGRSLLAHVLEMAARLPLRRVIVVVGHQAEEVRRAHAAYPVEFVLQEPQLGTGHAVMVAAPLLAEERESSLLVLYGDVPLLRVSTLLGLMERHELEGNSVTVLSASVPDPRGYGRIFRDAKGRFLRIVEDRDLDPKDRAVSEINSGIYAFKLGPLLEALGSLKADNAQGEYYLTDVLSWLRQHGHGAGIYRIADHEEISGINTVAQLAQAEVVLESRKHGDGSEDCEICAVARLRPELVLLRRDGMVVGLAPRPYNCGHVWIFPERHLVSYESLGLDEADRLQLLAQEAERWLEETYHPQGFNFGYNSGKPSDHLVMHVIPRWSGDANFMPLIGGVNLLPEHPSESRRRLLATKERLENAERRPG